MSRAMQSKIVNGVTLREDPAREPCFKVVQSDDEMVSIDDIQSSAGQRERLHRHMNNEIGSIEIAAQSLADFPDAPWELRMELARQTYDETRHVTLLHQRLVELGGSKGEFPVGNFEWSVTTMQDNLAARLAIQNRTFEAGEMDLLGRLCKLWRSIGDDKTANILEGILADEIGHVRFANRWIKKMVREDGKLMLKIARAMHFLAEANAASKLSNEGRVAKITDRIQKKAPEHVNIDDRRIAEFSDSEINEILRQSGLRSVTEVVND